jgi:hypothetical protein
MATTLLSPYSGDEASHPTYPTALQWAFVCNFHPAGAQAWTADTGGPCR